MAIHDGVGPTGLEAAGPQSQPGSDGAGAGAARSPAEDGAATADRPPFGNTGGTSSSEAVPARIEGNPRAAFTDWLNVTYPALKGDPGPFFETFSKLTQARFGLLREERGGIQGYKRRFAFEHSKSFVGIGGQRGTALVSISGQGCALVPDWPALVEFFRDRLQGRITRWDGAVDDYEGLHSVDWAVQQFHSGGFTNRGRRPSSTVDGDWVEGIAGKTFYVGNEKNGKLMRIYEKGKQLGDKLSPWVRWELELHNVDREVPWQVLLEPGKFVAGSYPCMSWVSADACRIKTLRKTDGISYEHLVHHARLSVGRLVNTMVERNGGNAEDVVADLRRPGVPKRLELTERLGLRGEKKK